MGRITIHFMSLVEEYKIEKELQGKSGVYMWTSPSGKSYIGLAKNLGSRHKDFRCATDRRKYAGRNSLIDKARMKMSIAKKGKPLAHLWKAVISTDRNGNEDYFKSINSAAECVHSENTKAAAKNIQCALKGRRASAYGRTWRYAS